MLSIKGTSHLKRYSSIQKGYNYEGHGNNNSLFDIHLKGFQKCSSYGGLTVMGEFFEKESLKKLPKIGDLRQINYKNTKKEQFKKFAIDIAGEGNLETLVVLLSNDYKCFLTDHEGHMLTLNKCARSKWDRLTNVQKCNYDAYVEKDWTKPAKEHLKTVFKI